MSLEEKDREILNKVSALLAELYQLLGRLDYSFEEYEPEIVNAMDLIGEYMHDLDQYFDDDMFDRWNDEVVEKIRIK